MASSKINEDIQHKLSSSIWVALLAIGFIWGVYLLSQAKFFSKPNQINAWLNGSAGVEINKDLKLPWQDAIQTSNAVFRYSALGDLGPSVAMGCPGWLFYKDGLHPPVGVGDEPFKLRLEIIDYWYEKLQSLGIKLLIVPVPDKARILSERRCGLNFSSKHVLRNNVLYEFLDKKNIHYVNLNSNLGSLIDDPFYRTDVHMNSKGAEAAADALATKVLEILGSKGTTSYIYKVTGQHNIEGDLIQLAGLKNAQLKLADEKDFLESYSIERRGGLLDEAEPVEVVLAGSSNGLRNHFGERLGMKIGREIWNLSMDGGQFNGAFDQFLKMQERWPSSIKLVIWEFSENTVSLPLTEAEKQTIKNIKN